MFAENDQMLFGGMQAADDAGLTGIHYVAAADGALEAYDYINGTTECKIRRILLHRRELSMAGSDHGNKHCKGNPG